MSHLEQRLNQEISELETAVLRAEARAYGRVYSTPMPAFKPEPLEYPSSIDFRWWFGALLVGAAMWGGLIWAVTR